MEVTPQAATDDILQLFKNFDIKGIRSMAARRVEMAFIAGMRRAYGFALPGRYILGALSGRAIWDDLHIKCPDPRRQVVRTLMKEPNMSEECFAIAPNGDYAVEIMLAVERRHPRNQYQYRIELMDYELNSHIHRATSPNDQG